MTPYEFDIDVHIHDTDCFNAMWHGSYTKWLEMGRVDMFKELGIEMSQPGDAKGYIYPVVNQNLTFKSPAQMGDRLTISTTFEVKDPKIIFRQEVRNHRTDKITLVAETICVVLNMEWKTFRRIPEDIRSKALTAIRV